VKRNVSSVRHSKLRVAALALSALVVPKFVLAQAQDETSKPASSTAGEVEVSVKGKQSAAQRQQRSAEAVHIVELRKAKERTADLGEVLAHTQGVNIRREGGLGSNIRLSLNGLSGDQIRIFVDETPLEFSGFASGVAAIPINFFERIDILRGVVPIRFSTDALGGALNLVSYRPDTTHLNASYQFGSFGTHRFSLDGRYRHEPTGFIAGATAFVDHADNDYQIDVPVSDARGRLYTARVRRFHDAYSAYGASIDAGVVDRSWAKRLKLRAFVSSYDKDLQHNVVMTVPYGEVTYGETVYGTTARYEVALAPQLDLEVLAGYAHRIVDLDDQSSWVYDWFGKRVSQRRTAGELDAQPHDRTLWQDSGFGRVYATWTPAAGHALRATVSPNYVTRHGEERLRLDPSASDPLAARAHLFTVISGLEYEFELFAERVSNIVFVKDYYYHTDTYEPLTAGGTQRRDATRHTQGFGDSLRVNVGPWGYVKASYEYATRLPRPDEVFGNAVLIQANLDLQPEISHNFNLGPRLEWKGTRFGDALLDINFFLRDSDRLIVLLGNDRQFFYNNIYHARGVGLENEFRWNSPGRLFTLGGTLTWQDIRNVSNSGPFRSYKGNRVPNQPYLFASWEARLHLTHLPGRSDVLEPFYYGRYVHEFFRTWENQGLREYKQTIDAQVSHNIGVSWTVQRDFGKLVSTLEMDNVTDAKLYDNFGVQRPGRAVYLKLTVEL